MVHKPLRNCGYYVCGMQTRDEGLYMKAIVFIIVCVLMVAFIGALLLVLKLLPLLLSGSLSGICFLAIAWLFTEMLMSKPRKPKQ